MNPKSRFDIAIKRIQFSFVALCFLWVGLNIFESIKSSGSPCERAEARLHKAQVEEQERSKEMKADPYNFTTAAAEPFIRALQRRIEAQQDARETCRP